MPTARRWTTSCRRRLPLSVMAADRVLGMRPYPVQLVGGIVLHQGRIAEMKTGEGKTLVATLPAYLNALTGEGVHIVTVNDYLAKRDSEWMGKVHRFMGLTVGLIIHDMTKEQRQKAYQADITYGTNNEMGFDYLRDNMAIYANEQVQRGHAFAIVDEVDSILIDEARTPLIISGMGEKSTQMYDMAESFAARLKKYVVAETDDKEEEDVNIDADYIVDEKARTCSLTARGIKKAEEFFHLDNLSDPENSTTAHHINQAIKAHGIMKRDVDYVVKDGEVVIVDEFTGRLMFGRRYSEGLHQAIEAKEHLSVQRESKTLATITFQNYFRLYRKLSGMTGTALTEEEEFATIYALDIIEIPTNRPIARIDNEDSVYKTENGKYHAVIRQVKECHAKGQPVLVGTVSIEKNELLGKMLTREGIKHNLLNAKNHEREAEIVAQAGQFGAVTVATNMAGRGTDIMLGGNAEYMAKNDLRKAGLTDELIAEATGYAETDNKEILNARKLFAEKLAQHKAEIAGEAEKVRAAGGLFIIGTERHDSRRIDNQLRGRAGRQGDPGETRFYISLEDDLMRLFGGDRVTSLMERMDIDEDTPIESKMLSRAIEQAQTTVESRNFQTRKSVLEYDDVMNKQREIIYGQRKQVLDGMDVKDIIMNMMNGAISDLVHAAFLGSEHLDMAACRDLLRSVEGVYFPKYTVKIDEDQLEDHDPAGLHRPVHRSSRRLLCQEGGGDHAPRHARAGACHSAACGGRVLDGAHRRHAGSAPGHPPAGLRPDQSGGRLQERVSGDVRGDGQCHEGGDGAPSVLRAPAPEPGGQARARGLRHHRECGRRWHREEAPHPRGKGGPQRPLPLRQRSEVEEVYLQGVPFLSSARISPLPTAYGRMTPAKSKIWGAKVPAAAV